MLFYSKLTTQQFFEIVDKYLGITSGIAMVGILFVFTAAVVKELHTSAEGKPPDYRGVIWTTVLVVLCFLGYKVIFKGMVSITETISSMLLNYKEWAEFIDLLTEKLNEIGGFELVHTNLTVFLLSLSLLLAITIEEIFMLIRYFFLAILYIVGPIVLVVSIYKPARKVFNGWILLVAQVLCWEILLRILQGVVILTNFQQSILDNDLVITFILTSALIISYIFIPFASMKLVNTENISLFYEITLNAKQVFNTKFVTVPKNKILQQTLALSKSVSNISNVLFRKTYNKKVEKDTQNSSRQRIR